MTPDDMVRRIMTNIEHARVVIDGPCGYVLHTADYSTFLCRDGRDKPYLASPCEGVLYSHAAYRSARTMQRGWNGRLSNTSTGKEVVISLRHDALCAYIDWQQTLLEALIEMGERRQQRREPLLDA